MPAHHAIVASPRGQLGGVRERPMLSLPADGPDGAGARGIVGRPRIHRRGRGVSTRPDSGWFRSDRDLHATHDPL